MSKCVTGDGPLTRLYSHLFPSFIKIFLNILNKKEDFKTVL